jgi:histidine phosphotransfer protein HptB
MKNSQAVKVKITVDPLLRPLLPQYLANRKKDLVSLTLAHQKSDYVYIRELSHKIRGHGSSYGFSQLTAICKLMEQAALAQDSTLIGRLIKEYEEYLEIVDIE